MRKLGIVCFAAFVGLAFAVISYAQAGDADLLAVGSKKTFTVEGDNVQRFSVELAEGAFAQFSWVAATDADGLQYEITGVGGEKIQKDDASWAKSAYFVAPKAGIYSIAFSFDPKAEKKEAKALTLSYGDTFTSPKRAQVKASRKVAGYDVQILLVPDTETEPGESFVTVTKGGKLKNILHDDIGSPIMGYSFAGTADKDAVPVEKKAAALINNTLDKTGDGDPDVMIEFYSGGAHCCTTYYFIELPAEGVGAIREVATGNAGMTAIGKVPAGGLRFETADNAWAYWNTSFADSPMPSVILDFKDGVAKPNFAAMKKKAPTAAVLKRKAAEARKKISNAPYTGEWGEFEESFWGEMIDLIFTGHEGLAWQYFDMVWPKAKPGKEKFLDDFKKVLAGSYYAERDDK
ncbi:MAG: hypothetical protein UZ17_ACD001001689 [Acidobacteria bacterium OLB17]|nr:MAG: hypothetical protein UZ17_ACD001001689 [Acidobacteria bacterium OLB17]MCZ2390718.1 hypothetical protein [Acidobacteriota bacterium]